MKRLATEQRARIIGYLVEGNSIRATVRMTGAAKNTVTKLLVDLGAACADYQSDAMRDLPCTTIECDEIWAFCYSKQKNVPDEHEGTFGYGDVWTRTALCADTKLVPSWLVGERTVDDAWAFLADLQDRLAKRVQRSRCPRRNATSSTGSAASSARLVNVHEMAEIGRRAVEQPLSAGQTGRGSRSERAFPGLS
jgi:hypothetical protein